MAPDEFTLRASSLFAIFVVFFTFVRRYFRSDPMLDAIPTIGFSDPILSYFSALRFNFDGVRMLKEGYQKTGPGLYKIANFRRWMVLAVGSELIEDVRRAPDDVLSMYEPRIELIQPEYTLLNDKFHTDIIPTTCGSLARLSGLTRNNAVTFNEVREELIMSMDDLIPMNEDRWIKVPILETLQRVTCRATNRILVGAPLCRNPDYQTLNLTFAVNVVKFGLIVGLFLKPFKPIVSLARMLSGIPSQIQQEIEIIRPMVEERFAKMEEHGLDWDEEPIDMLMCLMKEAKGEERSLEGVARLLLLANFAGTHLTSLMLAQILYRLLVNPEYVEPIRKEVDAVITGEGWTKAAIDKMRKVDSFLRETQRLDGLGLLGVSRLALRPFTFSNGVTVPAGTLVAIPANIAHTDESIYPNPDEFDGFRFAKLRESEVDTTTSKYQSVSSSSEHLAFGLGRHTCPGRFLAVNEIKVLFAHIVATYDIKFEEGKGAPRELCIATMRFPGNANVMFRKRQK